MEVKEAREIKANLEKIMVSVKRKPNQYTWFV